jgi:glutamate synthase domain-containing protein 1
MCGIAGLFLKDAQLEADLGSMLAGMLSPLSDRGPDSAGFAVYGAETAGHVKFTLRLAPNFDVDKLLKRLHDELGAPVAHRLHGTHVVVAIPADRIALARRALATFADVSIVGAGRRMELFKEVGLPDDVSRQFGLGTMRGTHAIGHTRMATESAVTTNGAHPFTTGDDQCLVHNGSLSNHCAVRRDLIKKGLSFKTENDTEVAAGFISAKLHGGASLQQAMESWGGCVDRL